MSHIVVFTNGMASDLNAFLAFGRQIRAAGHSVTYVSQADVGERVRVEGFDFCRIDADRRLLRKLLEIDRRPSLLTRLRERRGLRAESLKNPEIDDLMARLKPDLLVINPEMHYVIIATAALGVPTVLASVWFCFFARKGLPGLDTNLLPRTGTAGQLRTASTWLRPPIYNRLQRVRRLFTKAGLGTAFRVVTYQANNFADLKALARSRGYALRREATQNGWVTPLVYRNLPTLSFNAREMEFPHEPDPRMRYLGPMVDKRRREPRLEDAEAVALDGFLSEAKRRRAPLVYCSLGSYWGPDLAFLKRVIDVFLRRRDWRLVIGLGAKRVGGHLDGAPDNVLVMSWAPQLAILKASDCAITHAGISTVNECIACAVPMLAYSTKHVDQNGTAARVQFHGLGLRADKDRDDSEDIERRLEQVLGDTAMHARLLAMQGVFEAYDRSGIAPQVVESLVSDAGG